LAQVVPGSRVLDLFCGSGALGLEGVSRGAREVIFVDIDQRCVRVVHENIEGLGLGKSEGGRVSCFRQDAWRAIHVLEKKRQVFDLILADPPYHKGLAKKALLTLGGSAIVAPRGFVVLEHSKKDDLGLPPQGWALLKKVCYGDKVLSFFNPSRKSTGFGQRDEGRLFSAREGASTRPRGSTKMRSGRVRTAASTGSAAR
jgi:16S rRNA (guanine(966)-N(2))-methyltransferase RsmD